jgi:peptide/nickel transport system permease protein
VYTYIVRRILLMIPMMFIISVILFLVSHAAPGDPFTGLVNGNAKLDPNYIDHLRHLYGLDQPLPIQYWVWLKNAFQGNFGYSMATGLPVSKLLHDTIGNTIKLAVAAEIITLMIGIPIGIFAARKRNTIVDYTATGFSILSLSAPSFFIGLLLIYIFAITLQWLPGSGTSDSSGDGGFFDQLRHLILPALTLAIISIAQYIQFMRSSMIENMRMDFVRTARAKGLKERTVIYKHVLRNALIPIITLFGIDITSFLSGAPITEYVFTWPGVGQLGIQAVIQRDYTTIMAVNMIAAFAVLIGNLVSDILYSVVDPRIRYD